MLNNKEGRQAPRAAHKAGARPAILVNKGRQSPHVAGIYPSNLLIKGIQLRRVGAILMIHCTYLAAHCLVSFRDFG